MSARDKAVGRLEGGEARLVPEDLDAVDRPGLLPWRVMAAARDAWITKKRGAKCSEIVGLMEQAFESGWELNDEAREKRKNGN